MRLIYAFLVVVAIAAPRIWGQDDVNQQLYQAILLERQGNFVPAIRALERMTGSNTLGRVDQGRALILLGFAYKETGQFQGSQADFEKALNIFERDTQNLIDFTNALDFSGSLYQATGQWQMAEKMWSKVLAIYQQQEDHRGIAKTYANLAAVALDQKNTRKAKAFFSKAMAETAPDLSDDDRAFMSDVQGWIDGATKHSAEAVSDFEQALAFWKKGHGEEHPFTGWRYCLLGNAYAANGQLDQAITMMRQGLTILDHTVGSQNPRYLTGEIMYSRVLKRYGKRKEAAQLKTEAEQQFRELYHSQCIGCTVSVWSLR